jgi:D-erythronate 2-dehydrogenase
VRDGNDSDLPVSRDSTLWLMSLAKIAENLERALFAPRAALGESCALNLPCMRLTIEDLAAALKLQFPDSRTAIRYEPDPEIDAQFGRCPLLEAATAKRLGFSADASVDALIRGAMK